MKILYTALFLLFVTACSASKGDEEIVSAKINLNEVLLELPKELNKKDIWFRIDKNVITIKKKDNKIVEKLINQIIERYLPAKRSFTGINEKQNDCIKHELKKNNVSFTTKEFQGRTWIILETGKADDYLYLQGECALQNDGDK